MYVTSDLSKQKPEISDLINSTLMYYDVYFEIDFRSSQYHDSDEFVNKITTVDEQQVVFDRVNYTNEIYINTNRNVTMVAFLRDNVNNNIYNFNKTISNMYMLDEIKNYHVKLNDASQYIAQCVTNGKHFATMYELVSVKLLAMRDCPMFTITNQIDFLWQNIVEGIIFMKTDYFLKSLKYVYFNESSQTILVCVEIYLSTTLQLAFLMNL